MFYVVKTKIGRPNYLGKDYDYFVVSVGGNNNE